MKLPATSLTPGHHLGYDIVANTHISRKRYVLSQWYSSSSASVLLVDLQISQLQISCLCATVHICSRKCKENKNKKYSFYCCQYVKAKMNVNSNGELGKIGKHSSCQHPSNKNLKIWSHWENLPSEELSNQNWCM